MEKNRVYFKNLTDLMEILREIKIVLEKLKTEISKNSNDNLSYFI